MTAVAQVEYWIELYISISGSRQGKWWTFAPDLNAAVDEPGNWWTVGKFTDLDLALAGIKSLNERPVGVDSRLIKVTKEIVYT